MKIRNTVLFLIAFVSTVAGQYYGSISYSAAGCSDSDILEYILYPTNLCSKNSSNNIGKTTCDSVITTYGNCTELSCLYCDVVSTTPINECQSTESGSVQWKCFSSIPVPSASYFVDFQYDSLDCNPTTLSKIRVHLNDKCSPGQTRTICNSTWLDYYSCQSGNLLTSLPIGECGLGTFEMCDSTVIPKPLPTQASPSPGSVQNASWWGYAQYLSSCYGSPDTYISYANNACVEETGVFMKGSCSPDGTAITIYNCDSGCGNCTLSSTKKPNSCEHNRKYSCWSAIPEFNTSYVREDTFPQSTSCTLSPVKAVSQIPKCQSGNLTYCEDGTVMLAQCETIECGGRCSFSSANTTCTAVGDWSTRTSCYSPEITTGSDSSAALNSFDSVSVIALLLVVAQLFL